MKRKKLQRMNLFIENLILKFYLCIFILTNLFTVFP